MFEYVIKIENEQPVGYPMLADNFQQVFNIEKLTQQAVTDKGFAPYLVETQPEPSITEKVLDNGLVIGVDGYVRHEYQLVAKSVEEIDGTELKESLIDALAEIRWQHETGGITLTNGISVKTDRESQSAIFNGYNTLKNGLLSSSPWKFKGQWVDVTLEDIEPIAQAVSRHVKACFSAEKAVSDLIDKATDTDALLAIDLQHEFTQALNNG